MSDDTTSNDRNIAVVTHLGGIFFSVFPALVVWMLKKDDNVFVGGQAREALNFQITMIIAYMIAGILAWILIGFLLYPVLWLTNLILCILAATNVSKGKEYQYPFALRLIS